MKGQSRNAVSNLIETGSRRGAAGAWTRQALAFAKRYVRQSSRDWIGGFWSFAFPVLWYLLTVHLGMVGGVAPSGGQVSKAVLGISFGVFGAFTVTLVGFTGQLATDLHTKRYRKFRSLPIYPSADLAGRFVSGAILGVLSFAAVIVVAAIDGATYRVTGLSSVAVVPASVVLFCLVGMVVGLLTAIVIPKPQHATTVGTGVLIVVFFVTGYNGLVASMFPASPRLLNLLPNSVATRVTVYHLTAVNWELAGLSPPGPPRSLEYLLVLGGYAATLSGLAIVIMNRYVYASDAGE